jgi:hypothetical protein
VADAEVVTVAVDECDREGVAVTEIEAVDVWVKEIEAEVEADAEAERDMDDDADKDVDAEGEIDGP